MISKEEVLHQHYLNNLVKRLATVGEAVKDIRSIITEPVWFEHGRQHELCDLILLYDDFSATAIELKGSIKRRDKARHQMRSGGDYIKDVLHYNFRYGLFVVYNKDINTYHWERIDRSLL